MAIKTKRRICQCGNLATEAICPQCGAVGAEIDPKDITDEHTKALAESLKGDN